jgi:uncharacterized repeat protein (TIGR01451 family)
LAALGDYVWFDIDADGQQDEGEPGVPNVTVTLCNSAGVFIAATSTDSTGKYLFDNLAPGTYCVMFVPGPQFAFTNANVGADATDSDADIDTGRTGTYTLAAGERNLTVDAGLIDDVDLTLNKDLAPGQVIKPGELLTFMLNVTNTGKGNEPGPITVTDYLPTGMTYVSSTPATWACHTSTGATDTVVCVRSGSLAAGASAETLYITVRVAADARGQLVNTATVKGSKPDRKLSTNTGSKPINVVTASVGDTVWNDTSCDGIQAATEPGRGGVTLELIDAAGKVVATTVTDASGRYAFTNVAPGTYTVRATAPAGSTFSPQAAGADRATDSDGNATGVTAAFTLASGQSRTDIDFGLCTAAPTPTPSPVATPATPIARQPAQTGVDAGRGVRLAVETLAIGLVLVAAFRRRRHAGSIIR